MKLAFSTLACPGWTLHQVVDAALRYGYDGVELRLLDGQLIDPRLSSADRERVREAFAHADLPIVAVDSSVRVAADLDPAQAKQEIRALLGLASEWESPILRVFGGEWDSGRSKEQAIAQAREILGDAAAEGGRAGVTIALETHDRFSSTALVAEVLEGLPPAAGALWDVGHPYRVGDSPETVLRVLDGRIAHVHIKDCRRVAGGNEWQLTLLGEGEVPVEACIDALRAADYPGWLSVEWEKRWHPELAEPEVALPQFAKLLRSWM